MTINKENCIEHEMKQLMRFSIKSEDEALIKSLDNKTDNQLFSIFTHIINNNPFLYKPVIGFIVQKLYSNDDRFVALLCSLIEKASPDMVCGNIIGPIEEIALSQPEITLSISKKMLEIGTRPGICAGFMLSPLLGKGIIDSEAMEGLKSSDSLIKRQYLVALCNSFIRRDISVAGMFIPRLLEVAEYIDEEDSNIIIHTLIMASRMNKELVLPVLEKEIGKRGAIGAKMFLNTSLYYPDTPIDMLKKTVIVLETETEDVQTIDQALGKIYEKDPGFVVERLHDRLYSTGFPITHDTMLEHYISQYPEPVVKMMEEAIDNENQTMLNVGNSLLEMVFNSNEKSFEWCKKWKDDLKKEKVVIEMLAGILSSKMNHSPSEIVDEAIMIIGDFGKKKGIDIEKATIKIHLKEEEKYKEGILRALRVVELIQHQPYKIDKKVLERVLKRFPYVCKAIGGADWLLKSASTNEPHIFAYIYGWELDQTKQEKLAERYESEKNEQNKAWIAWIYQNNLHIFENQNYWEQVFKTLDKHGIQVKSSELKNNQQDYLSEAEITARLAPHFKVKIKPDIPGFETLDIQIEYKGLKALVEVKTVEQKVEHRVASKHSAIASLPGGKVKNALLSKFQKQLKEGKTDIKVPVLLMLNVSDLMGDPFFEVKNALYGPYQFTYTIQPDTYSTVQEGSTREFEKAFYRIKGVDIVTAICAYKRDHTKKSPLIGKLYRPFSLQPPRNPISKEFRVKLRDALFGDSEISAWQDLMIIEGIDESIARTFYKNGIEDLDVLASANEKDLELEGVLKERSLEFQIEAKRVLAAFRTGNISYLRGMDKTLYKKLTEKEIHLIDQILNITEMPEGVDKEKWEIIIADAKRIRR